MTQQLHRDFFIYLQLNVKWDKFLVLTVSWVLSGAIAVISTALGSGGFARCRIAAGTLATKESLLVSLRPSSARRRTLTRGPVLL